MGYRAMVHAKWMGIAKVVGLAVAGALLIVFWGVSMALAATPAWQIDSAVAPSSIAPGGSGELIVTASNLGDANAEGGANPITVEDLLPAGLTATAISGRTGLGIPISCSPASMSCTFTESLLPYEQLVVAVQVTAAAGISGDVVNRASVAGGGAPSSVSASERVTISSAPVKYGVEKLEITPLDEDGSLDTQAGSHPFGLTTTVNLNQVISNAVIEGEPEGRVPVKLAKDLQFNLPPGLIGNPEVVSRCTEAQFEKQGAGLTNECPADTVVGVASLTLDAYAGDAQPAFEVPLFNLRPGVGEPARFGFYFPGGLLIYLDTSVRTGGDYGVTVSVNDISQLKAFARSQVTFWGVPGDPRHDNARGWGCLMGGLLTYGAEGCETIRNQHVTAFLTLPTSCATPFYGSALSDSWDEQGNFGEPVGYTLHDAANPALKLDGCNRLSFDPSISVAPDGQAASTPTGLTVGLHIPQEATLTPTGLSEADVKSTTVTLPEGVQLNPAAADGLLSCPLGAIGLETAEKPTCPEASKVGTVEIVTPLLPEPLVGAAYLAQQNANPFGSLVALYVVAEDPTAGVLVKFAGKVTPNPVTGQLVSTFENTPPLPFSDLHLHFFGSARAPLSTPPLCGTYTTQASIEPSSGNAPAEPLSNFEITSGPNGAPCASPRPFSPQFNAGSTNIQAGEFTPFQMTMTRPDEDQTLSGIALHMPPGLAGSLSKVELCPEPQASQGACGPGSLIGHTIVSAGLGGDPFTVQGGQVFITGPYKGAPFGLSILNPAKAGPFDLGYVVVRAKVEVNPTTAALTIVSDPLPTIIQGIPLQLQHVQVTIERPEFTFNPTNCDPMSISATLTSTEGASATGSSPFQVTNCADLQFTPKFAVSTSGHTSRTNGASLDVKLSYPVGPKLANIAKVKVELPRHLPSRLSTLQKACTEQVFAANPESCPAPSRVGEAVATTPILSGPLTGPAYFVSHGGAKFPELVVVLRGEDGVTVDLHGETFISKAGVTNSTFATVPDVPVGSFELKLPEGPYSALGTTANLCESKLTMPTEFVAQNGAVLHQSTKISVTGCKRARRAIRKHRVKGRKGKKDVA